MRLLEQPQGASKSSGKSASDGLSPSISTSESLLEAAGCCYDCCNLACLYTLQLHTVFPLNYFRRQTLLHKDVSILLIIFYTVFTQQKFELK